MSLLPPCEACGDRGFLVGPPFGLPGSIVGTCPDCGSDPRWARQLIFGMHNPPTSLTGLVLEAICRRIVRLEVAVAESCLRVLDAGGVPALKRHLERMADGKGWRS